MTKKKAIKPKEVKLKKTKPKAPEKKAAATKPKAPRDKPLTQAAYSRKKGWDRSYTTRLVQSGTIKLVKGKVDPKQADKAIADMADPARSEFTKEKSGEKNKRPSMVTYAEAKVVEAIAKAGIKQLELKQRQGKLIDAAEWTRDLINLFTTMKTRFRAIPNKTAQEVTHLKKAKKGRSLTAAVQEIIRKEIDEVLIELSEYRMPEGKGK